MRPAVMLAGIILALLLASASAFAQGQPDLFNTAAQAQQHCPRDTVVWLNTDSGIWHYKGERWYGRTRDGAYVCEREAARAGDRATRNGQ